MTAVRNVLALIALVGFAGCVAENNAEDEAMAIANQVTAGDKASMLQDPSDAAVAALEADPDADSTKAAKAPKPTTEAQVKADATNAHKAAKMAKEAATVAKTVATHSVQMTEHAKSALKNANDALHKARVDSEGLTGEQKKSLKEAEKKLKEATKDAEYGQVKDAKYTKAKVDKKLKKLEEKMEVVKEKKAVEKKDTKKVVDNSELEAMRKELEALRKRLAAQGNTDDDKALEDLQKQIEAMEKAEKLEDKTDAKSHDEMKAEIEKLREMIADLEQDDATTTTVAPKVKPAKVIKTPTNPQLVPDADDTVPEATKVESKGLDIDTAMPYGELEPFGREDTAQELTEDSIAQSNEMVDQLEKAEVAEEKRSVFRALTRLRGAAITSFDGVARSQTGNIDEYNKINQWRTTHPLHHLADEESDVSKWAFPDNAD